MKKRAESQKKETQNVGFIACYQGEEIAFAEDFGNLTDKPKVKALLGKRGLVIKHTVPEGMLAVY